MKGLGIYCIIFYSPLDGMLVHARVTPSIKFAITHLYTWVERGMVRMKCLAQEHNIHVHNVPRPGREPRPLNLETSALTMSPPMGLKSTF